MANVQSYYDLKPPLTGETVENLLFYLYNNLEILKKLGTIDSRLSNIEDKFSSEGDIKLIDGGNY